MSAVLALLAAMTGAPIAYPSFPASQGTTAVARWLEREAGATRRDLVAVRDDFAWIMTSDTRNRQPEQPAVLRLETLNAEAWRRLGGRSAIVRLDTDCQARRASIRNADVYQGSNLLGAAARNLDGAALPVLPDTLALVAESLCRGGPSPPPLMVAEASASSSPVVPQAPAPAPPPPPSPPPLTRADVAAPVISSAPPPPAAIPTIPAPIAAPAQPPTAAAPPLMPTAPAQASSAGTSETAVQVGVFSNTAAAMVAFRDLAKNQPKLMAGKLQRLEPVSVSAGQLFRAIITGFPSMTEAEAFCRALVADGKPCLVNPPG